MLNETQLQAFFQKRSLEKLLTKKGIPLDVEIGVTIAFWNNLLIDSNKESQKLAESKNYYKGLGQKLKEEKEELEVKILSLIAEKNGYDKKIIELRSTKRELKKKLKELTREREKENNKSTKKINQLQRRLKNSRDNQQEISKELRKQNNTNNKITKKLDRTRIRISSTKQDKLLSEQEINTKQQIIANKDSEIVQKSQEISALQTEIDNHICSTPNNNELAEKDKKIGELEIQLREKDRIIAELRNQPPIQPSPNLNKLLATIQEKEKQVQQLETKLQEQTSQESIKRAETRTIVQGLKTELGKEKQKIINLGYYSAFASGVILILLISLVKLARKGDWKNTRELKYGN